MSEVFEVELTHEPVVVGESVNGIVRVLRDLPDARHATVSLHYAVRRPGGAGSTQEVGATRVAEGALSAGARMPFSLPLPLDAPFSCVGSALSVSWFVRVTADVPWAIDPHRDEPFAVHPTLLPPDPSRIPTVAWTPPVPPSPSPVFRAIAWTLVVAVIAMFPPLLPFALFFVGCRWLLQTRVRAFTVEVPPRRFALGENVPVTVTMDLKRAVDIERVTLSLVGTQRWVTSAGKHQKIHVEPFAQENRVGLEDRWVAPAPPARAASAGVYRDARRDRAEGPRVVWRTAIELPIDGLPTAGQRQIYYTLTAKAALRGFPDAEATTTLATLGARLLGPSPTGPLPAPEESSGDVVFLRRGEPPPAGIDSATRETRLWGWSALAAGGALVGALGVAGMSSRALHVDVLSEAAAAAGTIALLLGAAGAIGRLVR